MRRVNSGKSSKSEDRQSTTCTNSYSSSSSAFSSRACSQGNKYEKIEQRMPLLSKKRKFEKNNAALGWRPPQSPPKKLETTTGVQIGFQLGRNATTPLQKPLENLGFHPHSDQPDDAGTVTVGDVSISSKDLPDAKYIVLLNAKATEERYKGLVHDHVDVELDIVVEQLKSNDCVFILPFATTEKEREIQVRLEESRPTLFSTLKRPFLRTIRKHAADEDEALCLSANILKAARKKVILAADDLPHRDSAKLSTPLTNSEGCKLAFQEASQLICSSDDVFSSFWRKLLSRSKKPARKAGPRAK
uniref:Uncharacterized protein n=1 Tax=Palpitomonas bilix TaxID=652834 RepID=A0A7S3D1M3_9EUKA|mmetsp:Transcript_1616/g.3299  ORF Transcript_1616/g.3299 Transcript_1616/m.3299 type:complete len:303 (+) Transcript_1616:192-1100(+)